jgi:phenylacetate-CoA ligase
MSYRAFLLNASTKAKRLGLADLAFRYNPVVRLKVTRTIEQFRRAGLEERRKLTEWLTAKTIAAARASAYGRGFGDRYEEWPVLPKATLRDAPETLMRRALLRIPAATGGTTGAPLLLQRSMESAAAEQAFLDCLLGPEGGSWGTSRIAILRGDAVKDPNDTQPPFGIETHFGRRLLLSAVHLSSDTFPWYLQALRRFRPRILLAYPNQAINLLRLLEQARQHIPLQAIVTSSEQLMPDVRCALQDVLRVPVYDFYGQAERVCFATSSRNETYYFDPAYGQCRLSGRPTGTAPCP